MAIFGDRLLDGGQRNTHMGDPGARDVVLSTQDGDRSAPNADAREVEGRVPSILQDGVRESDSKAFECVPNEV